jgi:hypothetical protein
LKNNYTINGEIVTIYLVKRDGRVFETYIDLKNLEKVKELNLSWNAKWDKNTQSYYAQASEYLGVVEGKFKYKTVYLHRIICPTEKHIVVDHVDHNRLNNLESNLKPRTNQHNLMNRKSANSNSTTGYRNVTYIKNINKYIVQLQIDGKNTILGKFDNLEEAGEFAEKMREKYYKVTS